jgi:hypothetical protein
LFLKQIVNPLLGKVSKSGEIIDGVADYIFIVTVLQSQYDQFGVSYTARDNFVIAAADFPDPVKGLIKRCSISRTPVFDQLGPGEDDTLAAVWLPSLVPPLIVGLESLLLMGENAVITLPLKCNAAQGYYKAPPPHLLRLRQENADSMKHGSDPTVFGLDRVINLPTSP